MTDYRKINYRKINYRKINYRKIILKSSDRLKQEVDKEQGLTLFKFQ